MSARRGRWQRVAEIGAAEQAGGDAEPASLDVVEAELNRDELSYQQRAQSLDTKAGLLVTASGILVSLTNAKPSIPTTIAQGVAVAAAAAGAWSFLPRIGGAINPQVLVNDYLDRPSLETRLALLGTRLDLYLADEGELRKKLRRLKLSLGLLLTAALVVFAGSIITASRGG